MNFLDFLGVLLPKPVQPSCHKRILVLSGIPKQLKVDYIWKLIQKVTEKMGGMYPDGIFIPRFEESNVMGQNNFGFATVEIRVGCKIDDFKTALESIEEFHNYGDLDLLDTAGSMPRLSVSKVDAELMCTDPSCQDAWKHFLKWKLFSDFDDSSLSKDCLKILTKMFQSDCIDEVVDVRKLDEDCELNIFLKVLQQFKSEDNPGFARMPNEEKFEVIFLSIKFTNSNILTTAFLTKKNFQNIFDYFSLPFIV